MRLRIGLGNMEIDLRSKEEKLADKKLQESIERGLKDIREGRCITVDFSMSVEEIDKLLMSKKAWR